MKITFLYHSAFLVETAQFYLLFDFYKAPLPKLSPEKPLFAFASHSHADHFTEALFSETAAHEKTQFILARSIRPTPKRLDAWGVSDKQRENIVTMRAGETLTLDAGGVELTIETLKSTDEGVAFLLSWQGKTLYHAGDLNWWHWKGEDKAWNNNMEASFRRNIEPLRSRSIDTAFLPLDPRQEEFFDLGMDCVLSIADVHRAFPMHLWEHFECITQYKSDARRKGMKTEVIDIYHDGQAWEFDEK